MCSSSYLEYTPLPAMADVSMNTYLWQIYELEHVQNTEPSLDYLLVCKFTTHTLSTVLFFIHSACLSLNRKQKIKILTIVHDSKCIVLITRNAYLTHMRISLPFIGRIKSGRLIAYSVVDPFIEGCEKANQHFETLIRRQKRDKHSQRLTMLKLEFY